MVSFWLPMVETVSLLMFLPQALRQRGINSDIIWQGHDFVSKEWNVAAN
jgi:hypothetical protein